MHCPIFTQGTAFRAAAAAGAVMLASCNGGNGLTQLPPVTPAQAATVSSKVATTDYYVELHPQDAPDLAMLKKIHDVWKASGIRIDYIVGLNTFYDQLVADAAAVGLKVAFSTPYTNHEPDVTAYAQSMGASAKRYAGDGITWEIYNEPDLNFGEDPVTSVAKYVALAQPTALALKGGDPGALVLSGGTSGKDRDFVFAIAAGKALAPYVDGVAIHPYGVDYNSMGAAVVDVSLATGKTVYITEWATNGGQGLGQAMASAKGLTPFFCVYEYQEQALEKAAGDQTWGLVDSGAWAAFAAAAAH